MKAKVISSGEIIEVHRETAVIGGVKYFDDSFKMYEPSELEFLFDTEEVVEIVGWLCKNEYEDGFARIHTEEPQLGLDEMPITGEQLGIWRSNGNIYIISDELFPDLKWTDSPKKVKITITSEK